MEIGLAAASAVKHSVHGLAQTPQIPLPGHQAAAVTGVVTAGKNRSNASAGVGNGIAELPDHHRLQVLGKMHHIPRPGIPPGNGAERLAFQLGDPVFLPGCQLVHPPGSLAGLIRLGGKCLGYLPVLIKSGVHDLPCPFAADHLQPGAAPEAHGVQNFDHTHGSRGCHMDAAAGAAVAARYLHDPYRPGQFPFGSVKYPRQLLPGGNPAFYRDVAPDGSIQLLLQPGDIPIGNHPVKIHGDEVRPHVVALVVIAVAAVDQTREHMLPGVLLHQVKPAVKVDDALHHRPGFQRGSAEMDHRFPLFLGIQYPYTPQGSGIAGLSAALRVEGGGIQANAPAFPGLFAGQHPGGKPGQIAVLIK